MLNDPGDPRPDGDLGRRQRRRDARALPLQPADAADPQRRAHRSAISRARRSAPRAARRSRSSRSKKSASFRCRCRSARRCRRCRTRPSTAWSARPHPIVAFKYYDIAKPMTYLPATMFAAPVVVNRHGLKSLGPELEKIVREESAKAEEVFGDWNIGRHQAQGRHLAQERRRGHHACRRQNAKRYVDMVAPVAASASVRQSQGQGRLRGAARGGEEVPQVAADDEIRAVLSADLSARRARRADALSRHHRADRVRRPRSASTTPGSSSTTSFATAGCSRRISRSCRILRAAPSASGLAPAPPCCRSTIRSGWRSRPPPSISCRRAGSISALGGASFATSSTFSAST